MKFEEGVNVTFIGVGDGGRGARAPLKFGKKIFWQFLCKISAFFGQKSRKIREFFVNFSGKYKNGIF